MAVLDIAHMGNPILRQKALPVNLDELIDPNNPELQRFIDDLIDTMHDEGGVGIAAPQVSRSLQIVIAECESNERYPEQKNVPLTVLVNPEITYLSKEKVSFWEGCLSLKDLRGLVSRSKEIHVEAWSRYGEKFEIKTDGFLSIILQHEIDHLKGKLFIDRIEDLKYLSYLDEYQKYWLEEFVHTEEQEKSL